MREPSNRASVQQQELPINDMCLKMRGRLVSMVFFLVFSHCPSWIEREDRCRDLEGVRARLLRKQARSPRFQPNNGVLRRKRRWQFVFMVFFHCPWVWKGRTYVTLNGSIRLTWKG